MSPYKIIGSPLIVIVCLLLSQCNPAGYETNNRINITLVRCIDRLLINDILCRTTETDSFLIDETESPAAITIDTIECGLRLTPGNNYIATKASIEKIRKELSQQYTAALSDSAKSALIDSSSRYLYQTVLNELIPYWYGTPWDFEGHTYKPGEGEIACGYFVSTVLRDAGFRLNRYELAKQAALYEIKTIQLKDSVIDFGALTIEEFTDSVRSRLAEGLYYLGLDFHVGFLLYRNGGVYIIHSDYINGKVCIEPVLSSEAMMASELYVLGEITNNHRLLDRWLLNDTIEIYKP